MQSPIEAKTRSEEIARSIETRQDRKELQEHLESIIRGAAFRGSSRSSQFLRHVVEQAVAGHFESLKERAIGVELFGRSPTYDTGEDAIVRVTASDVRRRLSQHYSATGFGSEFKISLPPGAYIPEIARDVRDPSKKRLEVEPPVAAEEAGQHRESSSTSVVRVRDKHHPIRWATALVCIAIALNTFVWVLFGMHTARVRAGSSQTAILPWLAFFAGNTLRTTLLVTSDPNIAEIQGLTGVPISVSDYANQKYIPDSAHLSSEMVRFCQGILRGDKAANVDTPIVASIARLSGEDANRVSVHAARDLRFADLDTDNNLIFLGSPRTDPWITLFDDQLDLRFYYNPASGMEIIHNVHPRPGEPVEYVPTAKGFATGETFATISFIRNPNHAGQVLLLAGANAEGTKAAGELVTNSSDLSAALLHCGIHSSHNTQHFQILLRVSMMAGSPSNFDIQTCHILP